MKHYWTSNTCHISIGPVLLVCQWYGHTPTSGPLYKIVGERISSLNFCPTVPVIETLATVPPYMAVSIYISVNVKIPHIQYNSYSTKPHMVGKLQVHVIFEKSFVLTLFMPSTNQRSQPLKRGLIWT